MWKKLKNIFIIKDKQTEDLSFDIKTFGWEWVLKNINLSEEILTEYAEFLDWKDVFLKQDISDEFILEFLYFFKKARIKVVSHKENNEDFRLKLDATLYKLLSLDPQPVSDLNVFEKIEISEIIFTGKKGKIMLNRLLKYGCFEYKLLFTKRSLNHRFDSSIKKSGFTINIKTNLRKVERSYIIV